MKLSRRDLHIIILGVAFLALGGYVAISRTGADNTGPSGMPPASEGKGPRASMNLSMQSMSADVNMLGINVHGGLTPESKLLHYFDPDTPMPLNPPNQQFTDCKHRYPTLTGSNISTLIHHGYSALMVPSPRDYDWMVNPPSDEFFGG